jgi:hypothetical protein
MSLRTVLQKLFPPRPTWYFNEEHFPMGARVHNGRLKAHAFVAGQTFCVEGPLEIEGEMLAWITAYASNREIPEFTYVHAMLFIRFIRRVTSDS